tara:strand:- start:37 stop:402 length:366 start_codon:yes stop_codon:yes gene_type:complete
MKSILEQVYGVELASQKIELADFADIKSQLSKAEKEYDIVKNSADEVYSVKKKAVKVSPKAIEMLDRISRELVSDRDKFISKVKDLGIDVSKLSQPKEFDSAIKRIESLASNAKKMYNDFK